MIFDILKRQRGKYSDICNIKKSKDRKHSKCCYRGKEGKRSDCCHIKKAKRESAVNVVILKGQSSVIILKGKHSELHHFKKAVFPHRPAP